MFYNIFYYNNIILLFYIIYINCQFIKHIKLLFTKECIHNIINVINVMVYHILYIYIYIYIYIIYIYIYIYIYIINNIFIYMVLFHIHGI